MQSVHEGVFLISCGLMSLQCNDFCIANAVYSIRLQGGLLNPVPGLRQ